MTALTLPLASPGLNWTRIAAWSGTISLHALLLVLLLIPATALRLLNPPDAKPIAIVFIDPPPKPIPVEEIPKPPVRPPVEHRHKPTPPIQATPPVVSDPVDNPVAVSEPLAHEASGNSDVPVDIAPTTLSYGTRTAMAYPLESKRLHEQGTVILRILVGIDGIPQTVEIEKSSGYPRLDRAAREGVSHWNFHPGTRNGAPYPAWARVPVAFNLTQL